MWQGNNGYKGWSMKNLMQCGHSANAVDENNKPCCAICAGIHSLAAKTVVKIPKGLKKRSAICVYCGHMSRSSTNLPFFEYRPSKEKDSFYCGCRGF